MAGWVGYVFVDFSQDPVLGLGLGSLFFFCGADFSFILRCVFVSLLCPSLPKLVFANCHENYDRLQLHIGDKVCRHCSTEREDRGHDNLGKGDKGDSGN